MTDERPSWPLVVWLGIVAGAAMGALAVFIFRKEHHNSILALPAGTTPTLLPTSSDPNPNLGWAKVAQPQPQLMALEAFTRTPELEYVQTPAEMIGSKTKVATVVVSDTEAYQIMMASGGKPWAVQVRTVGPAGAFAVFGHDSNTLAGNINAPNVFTVPAGAHGDIQLAPGESLYARGSMPNTMVSISARMIE